MKSQEFTYAGQKITIKMEEETVEMDAVVVTGMFNRKKEGFTGSAVSVKGEDLKEIQHHQHGQSSVNHRSQLPYHRKYLTRF